MIHPNTELRFISQEKGYGVVATAFIPKGTITWVQDKLDREFTPEQFAAFEPHYQSVLDTYCFRNNKGNLILCWDHSRYVNHSFHSNCLTTAYDFEIAVRDIQPGEELTDDYGYLNIDEPFRGIDEKSRRKTVYPDDLLRYHKIWDKKIGNAFSLLGKVNQPLEFLLSNNTREKINKILARQDQLDSILNCYFDPGKISNGQDRPLP